MSYGATTRAGDWQRRRCCGNRFLGGVIDVATGAARCGSLRRLFSVYSAASLRAIAKRLGCDTQFRAEASNVTNLCHLEETFPSSPPQHRVGRLVASERSVLCACPLTPSPLSLVGARGADDVDVRRQPPITGEARPALQTPVLGRCSCSRW